VYAGDQGNRQLQVGATQRIADSHSGFDVFMDVPEGNGVFSTAASATNTGAGVVGVGSIVNRAAWTPDNYTLTFTTASKWEVTDGATPPTVVANGDYTPGASIAFKGVQVTVSGEPAAGDTFAVNQSDGQDMFTTISNIVAALKQPLSDPSASAKLTTALGGSLQQLDQASDHLLSVRAEVGSRLSSLDDGDSSRSAMGVDIAGALSDLRDLDYADAVTRMNQQLVGLQAAQLSYSKISQLSLFNYLR
jgi:flagellar hook-associated protein 3 FlgL